MEWWNGEMAGLPELLPTYHIYGTHQRRRHRHLLIFYSIHKPIGASPQMQFINICRPYMYHEVVSCHICTMYYFREIMRNASPSDSFFFFVGITTKSLK